MPKLKRNLRQNCICGYDIYAPPFISDNDSLFVFLTNYRLKKFMLRCHDKVFPIAAPAALCNR